MKGTWTKLRRTRPCLFCSNARAIGSIHDAMGFDRKVKEMIPSSSVVELVSGLAEQVHEEVEFSSESEEPVVNSFWSIFDMVRERSAEKIDHTYDLFVGMVKLASFPWAKVHNIIIWREVLQIIMARNRARTDKNGRLRHGGFSHRIFLIMNAIPHRN